jgi:hypothetical protein
MGTTHPKISAHCAKFRVSFHKLKNYLCLYMHDIVRVLVKNLSAKIVIPPYPLS